ncbi:MAG: hypothetical protein CMM00_06775 [Rhodopirellula sp.]|nr:hypothetical protein [Rhodopirellula sp.]
MAICAVRNRCIGLLFSEFRASEMGQYSRQYLMQTLRFAPVCRTSKRDHRTSAAMLDGHVFTSSIFV